MNAKTRVARTQYTGLFTHQSFLSIEAFGNSPAFFSFFSPDYAVDFTT